MKEFALIEKTQILPDFWIMEHFIGRSIIFEEDQIIISFGAWYNNLDYITTPIIQVGMNLETGEEVGIRHDFRNEWYDEFGEKMMEVYTFLVLYEKYDGEEEKGIHDRLGVTNENILVYSASIDGKTDEMLWNGDIIVIDENRIIVKLYQGWYMLVRE